MESTHSMGAQSTSTRSRRSSFALERASFDANRSSLERFGQRRNSTASRASMELAQVQHLLRIYTLSMVAAPVPSGAPAYSAFSCFDYQRLFAVCFIPAPASPSCHKSHAGN